MGDSSDSESGSEPAGKRTRAGASSESDSSDEAEMLEVVAKSASARKLERKLEIERQAEEELRLLTAGARKVGARPVRRPKPVKSAEKRRLDSLQAMHSELASMERVFSNECEDEAALVSDGSEDEDAAAVAAAGDAAAGPAGAEPEATGPMVTVTVKAASADDFVMGARAHAPVSTVLRAYAAKRDVAEAAVTFRFEGADVDATRSLAQAAEDEMDEDEIAEEGLVFDAYVK